MKKCILVVLGTALLMSLTAQVAAGTYELRAVIYPPDATIGSRCGSIGEYNTFAIDRNGTVILASAEQNVEPFNSGEYSAPRWVVLFTSTDQENWSAQTLDPGAGRSAYPVAVSPDGTRAAWVDTSGGWMSFYQLRDYGGTLVIWKKGASGWAAEASVPLDSDVLIGYTATMQFVGNDTIILGAPDARADEQAEAGKVYVAHRAGGVWGLTETLAAADPIAEGNFGSSFAVTGDQSHLVVMSRDADWQPLLDAYVWNADGTVGGRSRLSLPAGYTLTQVDGLLDGNRIVLAADEDEFVHLMVYEIDDAWTQIMDQSRSNAYGDRYYAPSGAGLSGPPHTDTIPIHSIRQGYDDTGFKILGASSGSYAVEAFGLPALSDSGFRLYYGQHADHGAEFFDEQLTSNNPGETAQRLMVFTDEGTGWLKDSPTVVLDNPLTDEFGQPETGFNGVVIVPGGDYVVAGNRSARDPADAGLNCHDDDLVASGALLVYGPSLDLETTVSGPDEALPGEAYTVQASVLSNEPVHSLGLNGTNLELVVTLAGGGTITAVAPVGGADCSHSATTVTCTQPTLFKDGGELTVDIDVTAPDGAAQMKFTADVSADQPIQSDAAQATHTVVTLLPPEAKDMTMGVVADSSATAIFDATDPSDAHLDYFVDSQPSNGVVTIIDPDVGQFQYDPAPGFVGDDAFTYHVANSKYSSAAATVTVHVEQNQPPVANDVLLQVSYEAARESTWIEGSFDAAGFLGQPLQYEMVANTGLGYIEIPDPAANSFLYHIGLLTSETYTDTFTYQVTDPHGLKDTGTVTVTVCGIDGCEMPDDDQPPPDDDEPPADEPPPTGDDGAGRPSSGGGGGAMGLAWVALLGFAMRRRSRGRT